jgi:arsenite methyltransferase
MSKTMQDDTVRRSVRERYGTIARTGERCCGGEVAAGEATGKGSACCGPKEDWPTSDRLGYDSGDLATLPEGADLGLGCGNPGRFAAIRKGETVVDLGSGGGIDCFLASKAVGESGRVIGVDMTPDMIERARRLAGESGATNVEFRLGEIEALPIADAVADVVISNCVVNLSPDKPRVLREAFRVLKPGGRVAISDIVALGDLPDDVKQDLALHAACLAGAAKVTDVERMLREAGFEQVRVTPKRIDVSDERIENLLASASVEAVRPRAAEGCCG